MEMKANFKSQPVVKCIYNIIYSRHVHTKTSHTRTSYVQQPHENVSIQEYSSTLPRGPSVPFI